MYKKMMNIVKFVEYKKTMNNIIVKLRQNLANIETKYMLKCRNLNQSSIFQCLKQLLVKC